MSTHIFHIIVSMLRLSYLFPHPAEPLWLLFRGIAVPQLWSCWQCPGSRVTPSWCHGHNQIWGFRNTWTDAWAFSLISFKILYIYIYTYYCVFFFKLFCILLRWYKNWYVSHGLNSPPDERSGATEVEAWTKTHLALREPIPSPKPLGQKGWKEKQENWTTFISYTQYIYCVLYIYI